MFLKQTFFLHGHSLGTVPVACADVVKSGKICENQIRRTVSSSVLAGPGTRAKLILTAEPFRNKIHESVRRVDDKGANEIFSRAVINSFPIWHLLLGLPNDKYYKDALGSVNPDTLAAQIEDLARWDEIRDEHFNTVFPLKHAFVGYKDKLINPNEMQQWAEHEAGITSGNLHIYPGGGHGLEREIENVAKVAKIIFSR